MRIGGVRVRCDDDCPPCEPGPSVGQTIAVAVAGAFLGGLADKAGDWVWDRLTGPQGPSSDDDGDVSAEDLLGAIEARVRETVRSELDAPKKGRK